MASSQRTEVCSISVTVKPSNGREVSIMESAEVDCIFCENVIDHGLTLDDLNQHLRERHGVTKNNNIYWGLALSLLENDDSEWLDTKLSPRVKEYLSAWGNGQVFEETSVENTDEMINMIQFDSEQIQKEWVKVSCNPTL